MWLAPMYNIAYMATIKVLYEQQYVVIKLYVGCSLPPVGGVGGDIGGEPCMEVSCR
jgi:hypothetical protein